MYLHCFLPRNEIGSIYLPKIFKIDQRIAAKNNYHVLLRIQQLLEMVSQNIPFQLFLPYLSGGRVASRVLAKGVQTGSDRSYGQALWSIVLLAVIYLTSKVVNSPLNLYKIHKFITKQLTGTAQINQCYQSCLKISTIAS